RRHDHRRPRARRRQTGARAMTTWLRTTQCLPPAGQLVRIALVPRGHQSAWFARAMISPKDGTWVLDRATSALGGTITHWGEDDGLDRAEEDWALAYARQRELTP